nr:DUF3859 domain-containing protein [Maritimibacter dapengensis]
MVANILKRLAFTGGAFAFMAGVAIAQEGDFVKPPLELIEAGVFCPIESAGTEAAPNTERGYIDLIEGDAPADFITTIVPGELEMAFGMRYKLEDGAGSANVLVTTLHPPFGNPPVTREEWVNTVWDDTPSVTLFRFDDAYEIQLGEWRMELRLGDEVVLRQTFFVIPPEESLVRLDKCTGPAIIS